MSPTERSSMRGGSESGNCALHASAKPTESTMARPAHLRSRAARWSPSQRRRGIPTGPGPGRTAAPMAPRWRWRWRRRR
ncbi:hypothetical protein NN561_020297 [Cricetulus griseus]